jgi:hypothetical protein
MDLEVMESSEWIRVEGALMGRSHSTTGAAGQLYLYNSTELSASLHAEMFLQLWPAPEDAALTAQFQPPWQQPPDAKMCFDRLHTAR